MYKTPVPVQIRFPYEAVQLDVPGYEADVRNYYYNEAVFAEGHETVQSLEPIFAKIKAVLDIALDKEDSIKKKGVRPHKRDRFDPMSFWRDPVWKELEDTIVKIFGFRQCTIEPTLESYKGKDRFSDVALNVSVYTTVRFPIEGIVTEKGFYDKSKSCTMNIRISLGMIRRLEPDELVACLLHEFGHNIDPALVNISYTETNILSKYLTDREKDLNTAEKRHVIEQKLLCGGYIFIYILAQEIIEIWKAISYIVAKVIEFFTNIIVQRRKKLGIYNPEKSPELKKLKRALKRKDQDFNRQSDAEAYADNFARMYGYGPALVRALKKVSKYWDDLERNWFKMERKREKVIVQVAVDGLKDEHKTDIHRMKALIREYKEDIEDPNTPSEVKKHLEDDLHELELLYKSYTEDFSEFQNIVNRIIEKEINKYDSDDENGRDSKKDKK